MDKNSLWDKTLAQIEIKLDSPAQYKTWFKDTRLKKIEGGIAEIGVKNTYVSDWLHQKHENLVKETLSFVLKKEVQPKFIPDKKIAEKVAKEKEQEETGPLFGVREGVDDLTQKRLTQAGINEKYTFANFVVGGSNRLAHAAALAVAENPGKTYNPLFIYGGTGLGKTHLVQAIGRYLVEKSPSKKILYCTSEDFLNNMVQSIRTGKTQEFRKKHREVEMLILDDIQFISKRDGTQEELFHTFNVLHQTNKQTILAADRPPEQIPNLEERLRSRFQGGMVADIGKPDFEMRLAILQRKRKDMGLDVPDKILKYLAETITDNIRQLIGALQKIALYNNVSEHELTIPEIAKIIGRDPETRQKQVRVSTVLKKVSESYDVPVSELKGPRRTANVAFARQIAMYILREEFKYPLEKTANYLNRKDHTTVLHAVDKIKSKVLSDNSFRSEIESVVETLPLP